MRQKNQFSSDINVKIEPKDDVIFLGIKAGNKESKSKDSMIKQSISFDYQKSQWQNRNPREDNERYYNDRQIERYSDRHQNYERHERSYDRQNDRQSQYDRQNPIYERHQHYYPPPPQTFQQPYYQMPYNQPPAPQLQQQPQEMSFLNNMFMQFFSKMISGNIGDNSTNQQNQIQSVQSNQEPYKEQKPEETMPEPAEIDIKQIQNIEHRVEVIPKACKINRFKFMVQKAPFQSKILVYVDGRKTMDFLEERLGSALDSYVFVNINDYKPDPDIGQLIMLTDDDAPEICKMKEVSICFNFCEPKDYDSYCQRCALFSGTGKKYSISYITAREEGKAQKIKEIYEKLNVTTLPTSLDQIIEAKAQDKSDDEKKEIYDTSFQFIKDERFTFRLPRGTKREPKKAAQQNDSAGGGAWGGGGGAQNQSNQGWGGGAQTQQNQGWGGGAPNQPANDAWGGGGGVVQENQTQDAWGAQNDQPQDVFGGQQQSKPVQDGWGSQPQEQNAEQQWGEQPTKKVHFEQPQEQQSGW